MLGYQDQYSIVAGIYFAFNSKSKNKKRTLSVTHGKTKRDKMKSVFPYNLYEEWTRENFIIASLYIMFVNKPSSLISAFGCLKDLDEKSVMVFKNEIIYYRKFLKEDIEKIKMMEPNPSYKFMANLYRKNEIRWFTFYFFIVVKNVDIDKILKSRIDGFLYNNIKSLLLYVTFSQKSMMEVKELMLDTIDI
jgi:hypothetical protein